MEVITVLKNVVAMEFPRWTWHSAGEQDRLQNGASRQMLGQRRLLSKMPGMPGHRGASGKSLESALNSLIWGDWCHRWVSVGFPQ